MALILKNRETQLLPAESSPVAKQKEKEVKTMTEELEYEMDIDKIAGQICDNETVEITAVDANSYVARLLTSHEEAMVSSYEQAADFIRNINNEWSYDHYVCEFPADPNHDYEEELRKACEGLLLQKLESAWEDVVGPVE